MIIGIASADYLHPHKSPDGKEKWGGAGWARIGQYVPYLRAAGHEVAVGTLWKRSNVLNIDTENETGVIPDVIIIQRIMHEGVDESIRLAQKAGQIVINDVDDWYWGLDSRNQAFKASHPKTSPNENTSFYYKNVGASDLITVSTSFLFNRMREKYGDKVRLLRNHVDVSRFTRVEQSVDSVTVGWVGSTAHRSGDLEEMRGVLSQLTRDSYVKLHHSGHHPNAPTYASGVGVRDEEVSTTMLSTFDNYPSLLNFDVGIVPLRKSPFNDAKSDIKGLEYAASGIPFVSSMSESYEYLKKEWGDCVRVAKRPSDWIKHLNALKDYNLRVELQQELLDKVKSRDIHIGAQNMLDVLEAL